MTVAIRERYVVDEKGNRVGVLLGRRAVSGGAVVEGVEGASV